MIGIQKEDRLDPQEKVRLNQWGAFVLANTQDAAARSTRSAQRSTFIALCRLHEGGGRYSGKHSRCPLKYNGTLLAVVGGDRAQAEHYTITGARMIFTLQLS